MATLSFTKGLYILRDFKKFTSKAVPNITVAIGSARELMPSEILYTDSTDYLLGGSLTLKNGRIDMYQFDEGYCQATQYNATQDNFTFTMVSFLLKLHLYVKTTFVFMSSKLCLYV